MSHPALAKVFLEPLEGEKRTRLLRRRGEPLAVRSESDVRQGGAGAELPSQPQRDPREEAFQAGLAEGRARLLEEERAKAHEEGFTRGLAEGKEEGRRDVIRKSQDAQAAIEDRLGTLDQWLKSIPEQLRVELAARLAALEDEMVALSFSAICRVLGEKIVRREVVAAKVRHAIEQCCGSGAYSPLVGLVAIHVHPKDYEGLETDPVLAQWLQKRQGGIPAWVPDDQVRLGGCIVRSSQGSLDARLETELGSLSDLLIQARASVLPAGENG